MTKRKAQDALGADTCPTQRRIEYYHPSLPVLSLPRPDGYHLAGPGGVTLWYPPYSWAEFEQCQHFRCNHHSPVHRALEHLMLHRPEVIANGLQVTAELESLRREVTSLKSTVQLMAEENEGLLTELGYEADDQSDQGEVMPTEAAHAPSEGMESEDGEGSDADPASDEQDDSESDGEEAECIEARSPCPRALDAARKGDVESKEVDGEDIEIAMDGIDTDHATLEQMDVPTDDNGSAQEHPAGEIPNPVEDVVVEMKPVPTEPQPTGHITEAGTVVPDDQDTSALEPKRVDDLNLDTALRAAAQVTQLGLVVPYTPAILPSIEPPLTPV